MGRREAQFRTRDFKVNIQKLRSHRWTLQTNGERHQKPTTSEDLLVRDTRVVLTYLRRLAFSWGEEEGLPVIGSGAELRHFGDDGELHVRGEFVFGFGEFSVQAVAELVRELEAGELDAMALVADHQLRFERFAKVAGRELFGVGDVLRRDEARLRDTEGREGDDDLGRLAAASLYVVESDSLRHHREELRLRLEFGFVAIIVDNVPVAPVSPSLVLRQERGNVERRRSVLRTATDAPLNVFRYLCRKKNAQLTMFSAITSALTSMR